MAELNHCPQCGCDMPPDSPGGLCPDCLFGVGLSASEPDLEPQLPTEARPGSGFVPPKPQDLAERFPQFELIELLGYGGMGAVYMARQKSLDRLVALKIIKPDAAEDRGFAERFAREAKALARLNHPNIVGVYDFEESAGLFYFVMEYVEGTNLRRLIESRELSSEQALQIIPQICEALQFAHDEGIVHRDIKPENILIDSKGRVKIADFGLAKLLGQTAIQDQTLTGTHQVMGTPRYMAPEQMDGSRAIDHRADIYSLGVVFYEMLTGELPMGSFEPPSRKVRVDVRLDEVVLRSLAREPERRYQHASDVKTDVESISNAGSQESARLSRDGTNLANELENEKTEIANEVKSAVLVMAFLACVGGCAAMIAPWGEVRITGWAGVVSSRLQAEGYRYGLPVVGAMMSLALFALTLVKSIIGEFPAASRAMLAAATGIMLTFTAGTIFLLAPLPNLPEEYSTILRQVEHHFTDSRYSVRELQILEMQGKLDLRVTQDNPGSFMSILAGVALIAASVLEMRSVFRRQVQRAAGNAAELLRGPATALRWAAWSSPLMIPVLGVIAASTSGWHSSMSTLLLVMLVLQVLHALLVLPLILISLARMETLLSPRLATAACILSMLPLGLSFVLGLPAAIWTWIVLTRGEVERAFRERRLEPHIVERQLRRAGIGLFVTAFINLIFWIGMVGTSIIVLILQVRRGDDIDMDPIAFWLLLTVHPLPILVCGCQLLAAWKLLKLQSPSSGFIAAVISLIPCSPVWIAGLPLGVWSLAVLRQAGVREIFAVREKALPKPELEDNPRLDSFHLLWGLCIVTPVLGLIGFALWYAETAWVLAALAIPWFGVCVDHAYYEEQTAEKPKAKAGNLLILFTFLVTLGLVALAIAIEHSAWPLFGIAPAVMGGFVGLGIGYMCGKAEVKGDQSVREEEGEEEEEQEQEQEEEEEEEESPLDGVQTAAGFVGMVGAFRCWRLLSNSHWSDMFEDLSLGEFNPAGELVVPLTGPVILFAAIMMYHARLYWLAVTGCVLCLLSGSCPAVMVGGWALVTLFDPKVRALFLKNELASSATSPAGTDAQGSAKPPLPRGYGDSIGSTFSSAWTEWWRERDALFTRFVQTLIMLLHLACLLAFLGFSSRGEQNDAGQRVFTHNIGFPAPWFTVETKAAHPDFSFNHAIHWSTSAWLVAGIGLGLAYIYCRIEKVRNPDITFWHKPEAFMLVWAILAVADIGLGAGMGHLATNIQQPDTSAPAQVAAEEVESTDTLPPRQSAAGEGKPEADVSQPVALDSQAAALLEAVAAGNLGRVKDQLDAGASVNTKDAEGRTLLMLAIANGHRSLALTLVVLGADLTEQDERGRSAMMVAVEAGDKILLSRLRDLAKVAYIQDATERRAELRAFSGVERALLEGRDYDLRNLEYTELECQADVNGETASLIAARKGDWDIFPLVASHIDSLRARDNEGRTIAMHAAIQGADWFERLTRSFYFGVGGKENVFIGEMLVFDLDQLALTDKEGQTALQLAEANGHKQIADILRRHLQAIVDNQTAEIRKGGQDAHNFYRIRALAWQALGEVEKAKEDLDKAKDSLN